MRRHRRAVGRGRFKAADVIPYIIAQVVGAIVAAAVLYAIASGKPPKGPRVKASDHAVVKVNTKTVSIAPAKFTG